MHTPREMALGGHHHRPRYHSASEALVIPGMTEDEMLAYALSLSLHQASSASTSADTSLMSSTASSGDTDSVGRASLDVGSDSDASDPDGWPDEDLAPPPPPRRFTLVSSPGRSAWRAFGAL